MDKKKNTPFWDVSLPIEERLEWLLEELTLEEKLKCLSSGVPAIERLGIPASGVGGEAAHGVQARNDHFKGGVPENTTSFVQPLGMSATWDPELIRQAGQVTGTEARVISHRHGGQGLSRWAPTVDLERDPRWGRNEEGYGEDPLLIGEMASAYIQGMQGDDPHYLRIAATLKHFYGNNTEEGRCWKSSSIDPRNRYELYLEPFRRAIEKGRAEAVMTAYNKVNGVPGLLNSEVQRILKDQYGLKHAVSDGGAMDMVVNVQHYYGIHAETLAGAVRAGVDSMTDNPETVEKAAGEAVELGLLTEGEIDRAVGNMFRTKLRLGLFDEPQRNPFDRVTEKDLLSEENKAVCRQVSREAVVLLKNDGILPLPENMPEGSFALIGPLANVWHQDWYGGQPPFRKTLCEGLTESLGWEPPFADGWDRVMLRCGEGGIAVGADDLLTLSEKPDVFVLEDWGEGSIALRCVRTGKYMNARVLPPEEEDTGESGRIAAEKDAVFDWFVLELFHMHRQQDGSVILTDRFDSPLEVRGDGSLWSTKERAGAHFTVEVVESGREKACSLAAASQTVILALGCNPMINAKEETDRRTIALPPAQEELFDAVVQRCRRAVVVLFSNYPYAIGEIDKKASAILWSATGAQDMGSAMAETVFGRNAPAGRLNMTWYADDSQLPAIDDYDIIKNGRTYRYFEGEALYPFGYGLTYTSFAYSDLTVTLSEDACLQISFRVKNTGGRVSDEVAQVYGTAPASRVKKPLRQLLGFRRLKSVNPGETRRVELSVPVEEFRFYDAVSGTLMVEEGIYTVFAGASSADARLKTTVKIPGTRPGLRKLTDKTAADRYDEYENIVLTEGQYGYCAAALADPSGEGILCYRDCLMGERPAAIRLYLKSRRGGSAEVMVNGIPVAGWEGDTIHYLQSPPEPKDEKERRDFCERRRTWRAVYTEVRLEFPDNMADILSEERGKEKPVCSLTIRLKGDVRLCYFRVEEKEKA